jgi:hypothetical protein
MYGVRQVPYFLGYVEWTGSTPGTTPVATDPAYAELLAYVEYDLTGNDRWVAQALGYVEWTQGEPPPPGADLYGPPAQCL